MDWGEKPLKVLRGWLNAYVSVSLKNRLEIKGVIVRCGGLMNILLVKASEYRNGKLLAYYGKILIRGNNILCITFKSSRKFW